LALITSLAVPAATVLLVTAPPAEEPLTPLPDALSVPGLGTLALRVAVPFFLLSLGLPRVKVLEGATTAEMFARAPLPLEKVAVAPSAVAGE